MSSPMPGVKTEWCEAKIVVKPDWCEAKIVVKPDWCEAKIVAKPDWCEAKIVAKPNWCGAKIVAKPNWWGAKIAFARWIDVWLDGLLMLVCALGVVPPIVCRKRRYVRRAHHARRLPELRWCVRWGIMPPSDCQNSVGACVGDTLVLLPIVCQIYVGACVGDYSFQRLPNLTSVRKLACTALLRIMWRLCLFHMMTGFKNRHYCDVEVSPLSVFVTAVYIVVHKIGGSHFSKSPDS